MPLAVRRSRRRAEERVLASRRQLLPLCDLCYMTKCPYVPPHPWNVDFPHLMLRAKSFKHRQHGASVRDTLLSSTDFVGRLAGIPVVAEVMNAASGSALGRRVIVHHARRVHPGRCRCRATSGAASARRPPGGRRRRRRLFRPTRRAAGSCCSRPATATATNRRSTGTCSRSSSTTASRSSWRKIEEKCCGMP